MGCTKELDFATPDTGAHLSFYWTMDEAGDATRVDSAQGHGWVARTGTGSAIGLFSNALSLDCAGGLITPLAHGLYNNDDAALVVDSSSKGISYWFWFKLVAEGDINARSIKLYFEFYTADFSIDYAINLYLTLVSGVGTSGWNYDHFDYNGPGDAFSTGNFDLALDTWHMFTGTVDFIHNELKVYLDGVLKDTQTDTVGISGSTTLGWLYLENLFAAPGIGNPFNPLVDEFGMCLNGVLTSAQVTSLYNSGAGKTWPNITPIVPYP